MFGLTSSSRVPVCSWVYELNVYVVGESKDKGFKSPSFVVVFQFKLYFSLSLSLLRKTSSYPRVCFSLCAST